MKCQSIDLVWITVKDFKKALKFYTEVAGLKVAQANEEWGWAELEGHAGKGMRLGIAQHRPDQKEGVQPGQNGVVTLTVDNIDQARQDLAKQGAKLVGDVLEVPGHVKMQTVQDNDGNTFQIVEDISGG